MSTLAEIQVAVDALSAEQKQELMLFLIVRLRAEANQGPPPRKFNSEQVKDWIKSDEADMQRFRNGSHD